MMFTRKAALVAVALAALLATSGCAGANTGGSGGTGGSTPGAASSSASLAGTTLNVLMVGNPQMNDLKSLTAQDFTAKTGINVNYTVLPENELRDKVAQDIATQAGQYDVATIGAFEASVWMNNDWLTDLQPYAAQDTTFDVSDILPPMASLLSKGSDMYAIPFYGESAFMMYRKDLFQQYGLTMPANPTWTDILNLAKQLKTKLPSSVSPICLRGLAGWGENMAVIGSMQNAFGGGFFTQDWQPMAESAGTVNAVTFYNNLITNYGEPGAAQSGFTECLNTFSQGKAAMWFDATSAATTLESPNASKVVGKVGYAAAPTDKMRSGWLWSWAWTVPKTTKHVDAAWAFISWASSKDYEQEAMSQLGRVPDGKRTSTASIPAYQTASAAYEAPMMAAINASDPDNCQMQKSPAPGCQYLAIPEFENLGTQIGQEMANMVAGKETVAQASSKALTYEQAVAAKHK